MSEAGHGNCGHFLHEKDLECFEKKLGFVSRVSVEPVATTV